MEAGRSAPTANARFKARAGDTMERTRAGFLSLALTFASGALILCMAAIVNGEPIIAGDTFGYLGDAAALLRLQRPDGVHPVFYGLVIWPLHWEHAIWPVVVAQGLVVAHLVWLTLRTLGPVPSRPAFLCILALLAVATPLSWYVSQIIPDIFLSVLILAMFLFGFCRNRLSGRETIYLILLAAVSICFHLSHLPTALVLASAAAAAWIVCRGCRSTLRPILLIAPVALALALLFGFSLVVFKEVSPGPRNAPFLLARLLADGPAKAYLRATCDHKSYVICSYLDRLPDTENDFLWISFPKEVPRAVFRAISGEEGHIVFGTARMFPAWVAWDMLSETARQLVTIRSETWFQPDWPEAGSLLRRYAFAAPDFAELLQGRDILPSAENPDGGAKVFGILNEVHAGVAGISFLLCGPLAFSCWRRGAPLPAALLGIVLLSLLINAFATGALSGVFGRYSGRAIWLLPFCDVVSYLVLRSLHQKQSSKPREPAFAHQG